MNFFKVLQLGTTAMMLLPALQSRDARMFTETLLTLIDGIGEIAKIKEITDERIERFRPAVEELTSAIFKEIEKKKLPN